MYEIALITIVILSLTILLNMFFRTNLLKNKNRLLLAIGLFFIATILWNFYATARGHWIIFDKFILGRWFGIPIEDYFMGIVLPFFCLTLWRVFK